MGVCKGKKKNARVACIMENKNPSKQTQVSQIKRQMLTQAQTSGQYFFFFSSRRRHTRWTGDSSSDVCSSDLDQHGEKERQGRHRRPEERPGKTARRPD